MNDQSGDLLLIDQFKQAMRSLAATPTVITASLDGERFGMAATSVTSLSADPPCLLVCINQSARIHPVIAQGSRFCVNILREHHADLCMAFGGKAGPEQRFSYGTWREDSNGTAYLDDAAASLFCVTDALLAYATHSIVVGRLEAAAVRPFDKPLIYANGDFLRAVCASQQA